MRTSSGFTLLEVLVALLLVGAVLLTAGGFFWQQVRIERRLVAARDAEAALENAYEAVRSGALALVDGPLPDSGEGVAITLEVERAPLEPLTELTLIATYDAEGRRQRRTLVARLYTP